MKIITAFANIGTRVARYIRPTVKVTTNKGQQNPVITAAIPDGIHPSPTPSRKPY